MPCPALPHVVETCSVAQRRLGRAGRPRLSADELLSEPLDPEEELEPLPEEDEEPEVVPLPLLLGLAARPLGRQLHRHDVGRLLAAAPASHPTPECP